MPPPWKWLMATRPSAYVDAPETIDAETPPSTLPIPGMNLSAPAPMRATMLPASAVTQALPSASEKLTPYSVASCLSMSSWMAVTATMSTIGSGTSPAPMDQSTCRLMIASAFALSLTVTSAASLSTGGGGPGGGRDATARTAWAAAADCR